MSRFAADDNEPVLEAGSGSPTGDRGDRKAGVPGGEEGISNRPDDEEGDEFEDEDDDDEDEDVDEGDEEIEPD
jgi:hypothetical protein